LKLLFKMLFLLLIAFLIYILTPLNCSKLIYLPNSKLNNYSKFLSFQHTPLNKFDSFIFKKLNLKSGWIRINSPISKYRFYKKAKESKREKTRKMVMFSGDTIKNFAKSIAKQANLNVEKLLKRYYQISLFKEGGILAQKYRIPYNTNEDSTISYMVAVSDSYFRKLAKREKINYPSKEFKERTIIASIIAKETQDYQEMPLISAVIWNRLKKGMKLQMDASLNHGKNSHKIVTPRLIKRDNSKYNTYKFKGLPPEPVGSFSKVALLSAFLPAKVNYIYFVKKPKGGHIFSSKYKQHIKSVKVYKKDLAKKRDRKLYWLIRDVRVKFPLLRPSIKVPRIKY